MFVAVERHGPVRAVPLKNDPLDDLLPHIIRLVDKRSHLMTGQLESDRSAGKGFDAHDWVNHGQKGYVSGDVHNNTAESFNANLERAKWGVFHSMSHQDFWRYLHEICFRWNHRIPESEIHSNHVEAQNAVLRRTNTCTKPKRGYNELWMFNS